MNEREWVGRGEVRGSRGWENTNESRRRTISMHTHGGPRSKPAPLAAVLLDVHVRPVYIPQRTQNIRPNSVSGEKSPKPTVDIVIATKYSASR